MAFRRSTQRAGPVNVPKEDQEAEELQGIERSADPIQLLSNILAYAGLLAAQWGEEILLHLRVGALWARIGRSEQTIEYFRHLSSMHAVDAFNLGRVGVQIRMDYMRYLLRLLKIDESALRPEDRREKKPANRVATWVRNTPIGKYITGLNLASTTLSEDEEFVIRDIVIPRTTWLDRVYLTQVPPDTRPSLVLELNAINEYGDPDDVEQRLYQLIDHCRNWHERQADTPIWVHDLDDVGPRAMYLAVSIGRPQVIVIYLNRCVDALRERPLALLPSVATATGGLVYVAKQQRRDDLLNVALDALPRLPEHERCISAIALVEVLNEGTA